MQRKTEYALYHRQRFGLLATASHEPGSGNGPASISIPAPKKGWAIIPTRITQRVNLVGVRHLLSKKRKDIIDKIESRRVISGRFTSDGDPIIEFSTMLSELTPYSWALESELAFEAFQNAPIEATELRMAFDDVIDKHEYQNVVVSYVVVNLLDRE